MQNSKIKISTKNSKLRGMNAHWVALPQCMEYLNLESGKDSLYF
jgi:hypothetical protein